MPHSHHSHSGQFCRHATGRLEDVVLEAIRKGFEVYGLTEHVPRYREEDLYPEEVISLNVDTSPVLIHGDTRQESIYRLSGTSSTRS